MIVFAKKYPLSLTILRYAIEPSNTEIYHDQPIGAQRQPLEWFRENKLKDPDKKAGTLLSYQKNKEHIDKCYDLRADSKK